MCIKWFKRIDEQLATVAFRKVNYGTFGGERLVCHYSLLFTDWFSPLCLYCLFQEKKLF